MARSRSAKAKDKFRDIDPKNKEYEPTPGMPFSGKRVVARAKPTTITAASLSYVRALYDPVNFGRGVGIPDEFTIQSQKVSVSSKFMFTTGGVVENAAGFVALNPHLLIAGDCECIYATNSAFDDLVIKSGTYATGITSHTSNSPYVINDFRAKHNSSLTYGSNVGVTVPANRRKYRLVSCRMRVTSQASTIARPGEMVGLIHPLHETLVGNSFEKLATYPGHARLTGERGNVMELFYTPVWKSEREYHQALPVEVHEDDNGAMQWWMDGSSVRWFPYATYGEDDTPKSSIVDLCSTRQPFMVVMVDGGDENACYVEIDATFEVVGIDVGQLATPSPNLPAAMATQQQLSAYLPTAGAAKPSGKTFGEKVIAALPAVAQTVSKIAAGDVIGAIGHGASNFANLFA